jgi:hypothetical protein
VHVRVYLRGGPQHAHVRCTLGYTPVGAVRVGDGVGVRGWGLGVRGLVGWWVKG